MIELSIFKDADLTNLKNDLDALDNEPIGTTYDYECRLTESCSPRELILRFCKPTKDTYGIFTEPYFASEIILRGNLSAFTPMKVSPGQIPKSVMASTA